MAEHHDVISTGIGGGTLARTPAGPGADSGGGFLMGSDGFYPEERPAGRVKIDEFWMDEHPVTVGKEPG